MDQFVEDETQAAFVPDGLASSHPVYAPVKHPDDILQIYDMISYKKVNNVTMNHNHMCNGQTLKI